MVTLLTDPTLRDFLESGLAAEVGTAHAERGPEAARGWGIRVHDDGTLDVQISAAPGAETLANLRDNKRIALTACHPVTFRSIQIKGRAVAIAKPTAADRGWARRQLDTFAATVALVGIAPLVEHRQAWEEMVRIRMVPEEAFDQTPGPNAGTRL